MSTHRIMVFIHQDEKEKRNQVTKIVSNVLSTYRGSMLAEVDEAQEKQLLAKGFHVERIIDSTKIKLRSIVLEPDKGIPPVPDALSFDGKETCSTTENFWIVQFVGPAKQEWLKDIKQLGGSTGKYIPENTYLIRMSSQARDKVAELDFVKWTGFYQPAFKISPLLMGIQGRFTEKTLQECTVLEKAFRPTPLGNLRIMLQDKADKDIVAREIENLGGTIISANSTSIRFSLEPQRIPDIAAQPGVQWIEPYVLPKPVNDVAANIIGVQPVWNNHGLDGQGQIIAVCDTGLDNGTNDNTMHDDFQGRITALYSWQIPTGLHPYLDNTSWDDGAADLDSGHGTHVAGSVLGSGTNSTGEIRGMAYRANLVFQAIEQYCDTKTAYESQLPDDYYLLGIPDNLGSIFQQSYDDGARIMTNSWGGGKDASGNPILGQYTTESHDIDKFIWDNKDAVILFAAGNEGRDGNSDGIIEDDSLLVQATAKNCITVGATENDRPPGSTPPPGYDATYGSKWLANFPAAPIRTDHISDNPEGMAPFSSRGPTDDGRIKPDVVAPGTNILSVRSSVASGNGWGLLPAGHPHRDHYMYMGGTSMATPITAGATALIRQYLQSACVHDPSAALTKAILIHGAVPITGQYAVPEVGNVPNNVEGWGRINIDTALFPEYPAKLEFRDDTTLTLGTGDQADYTYPVVNTSVPFRATLVWSDYPSTPAAGGLINQLRLSVIAPDGSSILGNPANNNVQQVVIATPQIGNYTVRISGINIPTETMPDVGLQQDFALAVTAGLEFVDVYIKDNNDDDGVPPSIGCLYQSPDIWVSLTDDPLAPAAPNPEYGQTNYVFIRTHNRGSKAADNATVKLYWANPGTNLSQPHWKTDGILVAGVAGNSQTVSVPANDGVSDGEVITTAFEWLPPDPAVNTTDPGHFCLFATIDHPEDPILQEDVDKVRWEGNLAWKNETVRDLLPDSASSIEFYIAGRPTTSRGELYIDCTNAPSGAEVTLKVPSRYLKGDYNGLTKTWISRGGRKSCVSLPTGTLGSITDFKLKPHENTLVRLEVSLPKEASDGVVYPVIVEQKVNGITTGKVHLVARTVGTPAYIANRNSSSHELHLPNCIWAKKISRRNKVPFNELELAINRGFNGCRYCLPEYSSD